MSLVECRKENLVLHAVLLVRTINKNDTKENDIKLFSLMSKEELVDYIEHFYDETEETIFDEIEEHEEYHRPSSLYGDYSPSCPWNAPGMSICDFI